MAQQDKFSGQGGSHGYTKPLYITMNHSMTSVGREMSEKREVHLSKPTDKASMGQIKVLAKIVRKIDNDAITFRVIMIVGGTFKVSEKPELKNRSRDKFLAEWDKFWAPKLPSPSTSPIMTLVASVDPVRGGADLDYISEVSRVLEKEIRGDSKFKSLPMSEVPYRSNEIRGDSRFKSLPMSKIPNRSDGHFRERLDYDRYASDPRHRENAGSRQIGSSPVRYRDAGSRPIGSSPVRYREDAGSRQLGSSPVRSEQKIYSVRQDEQGRYESLAHYDGALPPESGSREKNVHVSMMEPIVSRENFKDGTKPGDVLPGSDPYRKIAPVGSKDRKSKRRTSSRGRGEAGTSDYSTTHSPESIDSRKPGFVWTDKERQHELKDENDSWPNTPESHAETMSEYLRSMYPPVDINEQGSGRRAGRSDDFSVIKLRHLRRVWAAEYEDEEYYESDDDQRTTSFEIYRKRSNRNGARQASKNLADGLEDKDEPQPGYNTAEGSAQEQQQPMEQPDVITVDWFASPSAVGENASDNDRQHGVEAEIKITRDIFDEVDKKFGTLGMGKIDTAPRDPFGYLGHTYQNATPGRYDFNQFTSPKSGLFPSPMGRYRPPVSVNRMNMPTDYDGLCDLGQYGLSNRGIEDYPIFTRREDALVNLIGSNIPLTPQEIEDIDKQYNNTSSSIVKDTTPKPAERLSPNKTDGEPGKEPDTGKEAGKAPGKEPDKEPGEKKLFESFDEQGKVEPEVSGFHDDSARDNSQFEEPLFDDPVSSPMLKYEAGLDMAKGRPEDRAVGRLSSAQLGFFDRECLLNRKNAQKLKSNL